MIFLEKASSSHMAEDRAARIAVSQNLLLDLVESEADRRAAEAPQTGFKRERVERRYTSFPHHFNKLELTVEAPCGMTLELEANRPDENSTCKVQCMVGIFGMKRHEKATKLEHYVFVPCLTRHGAVSWQHRDGTNYTPQQLCDFAFQRLREHTERCSR